MKIFGKGLFAACMILAATAAGAIEHTQGRFGTFGEWSFETGQGIRVSITRSGGASLEVACAPPEVFVKSALLLGVDGQSLNGDIGFRFDNGETVTVLVQNNNFRADTAENARLFAQVVSGLKRRNTVELLDGSATIATFSLRGSSKAIGDCTVRNVGQ